MSRFAHERKKYDSYFEINNARPSEDVAMPSESTNYLDDLD